MMRVHSIKVGITKYMVYTIVQAAENSYTNTWYIHLYIVYTTVYNGIWPFVFVINSE